MFAETAGIIVFLLLISSAFAVGLFLYRRERKVRAQFEVRRAELEDRESKMHQRMYELAILKELGDRVGYSLDVHQIVDVITGSLHQFIEYSAVSYMLIEPEKVLFKVHLEKSVHRGFIDEVRDRMLKSLSALLEKEFKREQVNEILSGAIIVDEVEEPVRSFFNIPLAIGDRVVGVLTVSDTKAGLYKEEEMTILYKITSQASKAVTKLQEVVKTEQSKLNAMVESMADGVVMTDLDYRVMVVNPSAKNIIGWQGKNEVTIFDFIDKLGNTFDIRGKLEESVKLNKSYILDKILINDKFFQIFTFPVLNKYSLKAGEVLGGVVIFHDITHEIELERIRKDFTSMIVHELRSPLDGIKKISELLRNKETDVNSANTQEYLQMVYQNASRMLDLVNDILDLAKLEAGKFEIRLEAADIKDIINNRISFYELAAKDAGIKLNPLFGNDLPDALRLDPRAIQQVLNNFISNALKFTKSGGEVKIIAFLHKKGFSLSDEFLTLGVSSGIPINADLARDYPNAIAIAVYDTGIGIALESISQLFGKFKQLYPASLDGKKGTGLGLSIAKALIEAHKGTVGAISKEKVGSIFYFMIPFE
ncbi:hypothetical protein A3B05_01365 [Candidatus Giovannonibacteria bacterium RIFCSPLOWO2_01_FULL_43_160]|uniref:histidine kinase n=2 Tax=Candidatus Giovannoniibacteriota TaxID=1752738 RepID=A0A0G1IW73_9BACT|nr:MAG: Response regulator receiver modulated diguanylate cyclase with PAS/PAC sensor [Candidatus Giovannonibacteria bacterium GW2011_GWB1_43_13]KKS99336.1 MAG: Response regulator receiver modulated diguanylate cyclase with PAS/PAC sensor [Candidatus Giovannonibacteria bacterium GW2011_GWA1_43_15]KKT63310.1 MAG: Response regulator receiver modulated diguanylate cyclase with PAS/PAC sensor [Candidatus Giovannonibacteria bacterium GW2011_GWA2_44_26]OGF59236.1 MAG: hypothetical protein A2652_00850 